MTRFFIRSVFREELVERHFKAGSGLSKSIRQKKPFLYPFLSEENQDRW